MSACLGWACVEGRGQGSNLESKAMDEALAIAEAQGVVPLIKLCTTGTMEAKQHSTSALFHLALDNGISKFIGTNGGIVRCS